jgi:hypothetical protein
MHSRFSVQNTKTYFIMKKQNHLTRLPLRRRNRTRELQFSVRPVKPKHPENLCLNDVVNYLFNANAREHSIIRSMFYNNNRRAAV